MNQEVQPSIGKTSRGMLWLAALALVFVLTWFFDYLGAGGGERAMRVSGATVTIPADRQGHYRAEGEINGVPVDFLLDTGATDVAIPERLAERLGLARGPQIRLQTANGISRGYLTRIERVRLGSLEVRNVRAVITPGLSGEALLGMSFLRHLDWRRNAEELILEPGSS